MGARLLARRQPLDRGLCVHPAAGGLPGRGVRREPTAHGTSRSRCAVDYFVNTPISSAGRHQRVVRQQPDVRQPRSAAAVGEHPRRRHRCDRYRQPHVHGQRRFRRSGSRSARTTVRLVAPGEFNAEIDSARSTAGSNQVVLTAIDNAGNQSTIDRDREQGHRHLVAAAVHDQQVAGGNATARPGHRRPLVDPIRRNDPQQRHRLRPAGRDRSGEHLVAVHRDRAGEDQLDGSRRLRGRHHRGLAGRDGATCTALATSDQPRSVTRSRRVPVRQLGRCDAQGDIYANSDAHPEQSLQSDLSGTPTDSRRDLHVQDAGHRQRGRRQSVPGQGLADRNRGTRLLASGDQR